MHSRPPQPSAVSPSRLNALPGGMNQTLFSEVSKALITMLFSSQSYCICQFTIRTQPENTQGHTSGSPRLHTYSNQPYLLLILLAILSHWLVTEHKEPEASGQLLSWTLDQLSYCRLEELFSLWESGYLYQQSQKSKLWTSSNFRGQEE